MASATTAWDPDDARSLIHERAHDRGALLPILHDLQTRYGYIDAEAISIVAQELNVSKAETIGVVSFYHDFRAERINGVHIKLCRAESCQAAGCESLVAHLATSHGLRVDKQTDPDLTIETVYCLGHCAASPAALVDDKPVARLDTQKLDAMIADIRKRVA